jgi:putative endonuclease
MPYYVYILASRKHGTLTIGVTNDTTRHVWEHRQGRGSRFVKRYRVTRLVHVETRGEIARTIQRDNPEWDDLYEGLNGKGIGSRQQVPGRQHWLWQGRA